MQIPCKESWVRECVTFRVILTKKHFSPHAKPINEAFIFGQRQWGKLLGGWGSRGLRGIWNRFRLANELSHKSSPGNASTAQGRTTIRMATATDVIIVGASNVDCSGEWKHNYTTPRLVKCQCEPCPPPLGLLADPYNSSRIVPFSRSTTSLYCVTLSGILLPYISLHKLRV